MVDWRYADGAKYLPSDEVVKKLRPRGGVTLVSRSAGEGAAPERAG